MKNLIKIIQKELRNNTELSLSQKESIKNQIYHILHTLNNSNTEKNSKTTSDKSQVNPQEINQKIKNLMKPLEEYNQKVTNVIKANQQTSKKIKEETEEILLEMYSNQAKSLDSNMNMKPKSIDTDNSDTKTMASQ